MYYPSYTNVASNMTDQINNISLRCPCCNEIRSYAHLEHLIKYNVQYEDPHLLSLIECAERGFLRWACDKCLNDGKAIIAKPDKQYVYGITDPYFFYYDQQCICSTCGIEFNFSKEEQQYWYEELKFMTRSKAKDCKDCRWIKRTPNKRKTKIFNLIKKLEPDNLDQIESLVRFYLEIDNVEKANYFLDIGNKNVKDKSNDEARKKLDKMKEMITTHNKT